MLSKINYLISNGYSSEYLTDIKALYLNGIVEGEVLENLLNHEIRNYKEHLDERSVDLFQKVLIESVQSNNLKGLEEIHKKAKNYRFKSDFYAVEEQKEVIDAVNVAYKIRKYLFKY